MFVLFGKCSLYMFVVFGHGETCMQQPECKPHRSHDASTINVISTWVPGVMEARNKKNNNIIAVSVHAQHRYSNIAHDLLFYVFFDQLIRTGP